MANMLNKFFTESANVVSNANNADNGVIYNKKAFDAFCVDAFPESVKDGVIMPSKYEIIAKKARKKLRQFLLQTLEAFLQCNDAKSKEKFAKEFANFYAEFYRVNDYTVASVTNGKMKSDAMATITKAMQQLEKMQKSDKQEKSESKKQEKQK